ncbi:hypothetical protein Tco_0178064 [Tanacetum coccineum]
MSSAKAEYVAAARCYANILWMKSQLTDYDIIYEKLPIFCDNTSAIAISNNPVLHSRTKHIDNRYHFIRDHILKGDIELHLIPTQYQLVDIFTKPLDEPTFKRLIVELGRLSQEHPHSTKSTWVNFGTLLKLKTPIEFGSQPPQGDTVEAKGIHKKGFLPPRKKKSSSAKDSNLSQPLASTPVVSELHKEDLQASSGLASLEVTEHEASVASIVKLILETLISND